MSKKKPEILAPAGDLEKLYFALRYGADAVYAGGKEYSLRAKAGNFSLEELAQGIALAHSLNKKLYLTVNIFARNQDLSGLPDYLGKVAALGVDALIISDPGIFALARKYAPQIPIHISTQANNVNWSSANFWQKSGAKRIVLGRELSFNEVAEIREKGGLETEIFVHGAICISYSGRCLLSSFLNQRDANQGNCTHPCRWKYRLYGREEDLGLYLQEEKRPGEYFPVEEDEKGTYIFNSKDLCLLPLINELLETGVDAWKIEGRNKSAYYVANIVRAYRIALDSAWEAEGRYEIPPYLLEEAGKISHRDYTSAFAVATPGGQEYRYQAGEYLRGYDFAGIVHNKDNQYLTVEQRNNLTIGDIIDILLPNGENLSLPIQGIIDEEGKSVPSAPHPKQIVRIPFESDQELELPLLIRRKQR